MKCELLTIDEFSKSVLQPAMEALARAMAKSPPIERLFIRRQTYCSLLKVGITSIDVLAEMSAADLLKIKGFGPVALKELREATDGIYTEFSALAERLDANDYR